jgi:WD40 repeat protein
MNNPGEMPEESMKWDIDHIYNKAALESLNLTTSNIPHIRLVQNADAFFLITAQGNQINLWEHESSLDLLLSYTLKPSDTITCLDISFTEKLLIAVGTDDGLIYVFDTEEKKKVSVPRLIPHSMSS